jgi:hypothetical protein
MTYVRLTALVLATLGTVALVPTSAAAAAAPARSVVFPAELAGGDLLPVTRRKTFVVPNRNTAEVLVFAPYTVNDFRTGWTNSRSRTSRRGASESFDAQSERTFTFALHGGSAPLLVECAEKAAAAASGQGRGSDLARATPDHDLRCTLHVPAGGPFELRLVNAHGELNGVGGERFSIGSLSATRSRWEAPGATGLLLRGGTGAPVAAVDFGEKGLVVLQRDLEPARRELLAAAAAALLLGDLAR